MQLVEAETWGLSHSSAITGRFSYNYLMLLCIFSQVQVWHPQWKKDRVTEIWAP